MNRMIGFFGSYWDGSSPSRTPPCGLARKVLEALAALEALVADDMSNGMVCANRPEDTAFSLQERFLTRLTGRAISRRCQSSSMYSSLMKACETRKSSETKGARQGLARAYSCGHAVGAIHMQAVGGSGVARVVPYPASIFLCQYRMTPWAEGPRLWAFRYRWLADNNSQRDPYTKCCFLRR